MGVGDNALQRTFELTHVGADALGNKEGGIMRQVDFGLISLLHQNRNAGFQLWWLYRYGKAPTEA